MDSNAQIYNQLYSIMLTKIKTIIVKNLSPEDKAEFIEIVHANDTKKLLTFAHLKIPNFYNMVAEETNNLIIKLNTKI